MDEKNRFLSQPGRLFPEYPAGLQDSAVLLLLYPGREGTTFSLIQRPVSMPLHPGQVALPGGACESEETAEQTALRETEEEIGYLLLLKNVLQVCLNESFGAGPQ